MASPPCRFRYNLKRNYLNYTHRGGEHHRGASVKVRAYVARLHPSQRPVTGDKRRSIFRVGTTRSACGAPPATSGLPPRAGCS